MKAANQRVVGQQVPDPEKEVEFRLGLGCHRGAIYNLTGPFGHGRDLWPILVPDHHPDLREVGHHVRCHAGRFVDIVDSRRRQHVLPHLVDGMAKQFCGVEGGSAVPGRITGMGRSTAKDDTDAVICRCPNGTRGGDGCGMPGQGDIHVIEEAVAHHVDLDAL